MDCGGNIRDGAKVKYGSVSNVTGYNTFVRSFSRSCQPPQAHVYTEHLVVYYYLRTRIYSAYRPCQGPVSIRFRLPMRYDT